MIDQMANIEGSMQLGPEAVIMNLESEIFDMENKLVLSNFLPPS